MSLSYREDGVLRFTGQFFIRTSSPDLNPRLMELGNVHAISGYHQQGTFVSGIMDARSRKVHPLSSPSGPVLQILQLRLTGTC